ncbi:hypothetical protein MERGE_001579 [Pneumocystis wakefieldiae]|uniref:GPI ethanolamine phosphate transferase 1 n=1 Tax=Pneumocystis wakefieldiae TaxID=38082 RepID=A0A899G710_9ASCO|nr:hypothetical protein MERGE_001579 [Pneumocystis wakefieldiae]
MNSVGQLPLDYLSCSLDIKSQAAFTNALEVAEQYKIKHEYKSLTKIAFKPFKHLNNKTHNLDTYKNHIETLINDHKYNEAIKFCEEMIKICLEGLQYLQTYDSLFLLSIITSGYLGWIAFMFIQLVNIYIPNDTYQPKRTIFSSLFFSFILIGLFSILYIEKSPLFYYAYIIFPIFFWEHIITNRKNIYKCYIFFKNIKRPYKNTIFFMKLILYIILLETIVIGYYQRMIFTAYFILISFWPLTHGIKFIRDNKILISLWMLNSFITSTFTLLDTVKKERLSLILIGGFVMFLFGTIYLIFGDLLLKKNKTTTKMPQNIISIQLGLLILSIVVTYSSVLSLRAKKGLPFGNQVVGWLVLVFSLMIPFISLMKKKNYYIHNLLIIFLMFSPSFVILSVSYENIFYICFFITLVLWVQIEYKIRLKIAPRSRNKELEKNQELLFHENLRTGLFYLFFIQEAFFGTGNFASISSFTLDSVYRLIPIFNPFSQAALLLFKLMIPYIILSANLEILNQKLRNHPSTLFIIVLYNINPEETIQHKNLYTSLKKYILSKKNINV